MHLDITPNHYRFGVLNLLREWIYPFYHVFETSYISQHHHLMHKGIHSIFLNPSIKPLQVNLSLFLIFICSQVWVVSVSQWAQFQGCSYKVSPSNFYLFNPSSVCLTLLLHLISYLMLYKIHLSLKLDFSSPDLLFFCLHNILAMDCQTSAFCYIADQILGGV